MPVPNNVIRFEVCLYLSLLLDTLSAAIQGAPDDAGIGPEPAVNFINALFILAFVFLVGYAARRRKNWARMTLLVAMVLAALSLLSAITTEGLQSWTGIDVISTVLTAAGLYFSFTRDAKGWFSE